VEGIRSYLLAVVAVGILCSVAETLGPQKGVNQQLIKTLCGVIMLLTAFGPVLKLIFLVGIFLTASAYLVDGSFSPFLYFRF